MDIAALKEAAEKATPGPWDWFDALASFHVVSLSEDFMFRDTKHRQHVALMCKNYGDDTGSLREGREQANAQYIALANPTAILSLIERYQAMEEALLDQIPTHRSPLAMCWCHMSRDIAGYGHADNCLKARAVFSEPV